MPRYFFHVADSKQDTDAEGVVLAGLDEARAQAVKTAGEILVTEGMAFWVGGQWGMTVVGEDGITVFSLRIEAGA